MRELASFASGANDPGLLHDIVAAAEVMSVGFGMHALAQDGLQSLIGITDATLVGDVDQALANLQFHAGPELARFLQDQVSPARARRIGTLIPTVAAADFPNWIDRLFVDQLLRNDQFRDQVIDALRHASGSRRTHQLLARVVPWVTDLVRS